MSFNRYYLCPTFAKALPLGEICKDLIDVLSQQFGWEEVTIRVIGDQVHCHILTYALGQVPAFVREEPSRNTFRYTVPALVSDSPVDTESEQSDALDPETPDQAEPSSSDS